MSNGLIVCKPTSVVGAGTPGTASINANGSVAFNGSSVLLNGVFSADYDNYMISIRSVDSLGTSPYLNCYFSVSGVIASGSNYTTQRTQASATSIASQRSTTTSGEIGGSSNAQRDGTTMYVFGPFNTAVTTWRAVSTYGENGGILHMTAGIHAVDTSYDGIQIFPTGGEITGQITVYGFNQ